MRFVRRAHLYLGLFLFPWAVLYGVSAFLFNHPAAFGEQPMRYFGPDAVRGTPLEALPTPTEQAERVVKLLNERQTPAAPYTLAAGEVKYNREFAFATVRADGQTVSVLIDVRNGGGTVRSAPDKPKAGPPPKAPFATAPASPTGRPSQPPERLVLPDPLPERVKAAIPVILERTGFPTGDVTVTSVPELVFPVVADGATWTATYNPMTGAVSGAPAEAKPEAELGWRRFVLRLHAAHGYPNAPDARWFWAAVVDLTAGAFCFWGLSGLLMWWQVKATRKAGAVVLALSAASAAALGFAMHAAFTG